MEQQSEYSFERDILQRLTRIESHQETIMKDCGPCQSKIDTLEITVAENKASTKAAHHRLDAILIDRSELKTDLKEAIKEQISGIYRTAIIVGGVTSFFVGIIVSLIMLALTGHWGHG